MLLQEMLGFGQYGLEEIFATLESLKVELQMMKEPMGRTKENPGRSCRDIWLCHRDFPSGKIRRKFLKYLPIITQYDYQLDPVTMPSSCKESSLFD